MSFNILCIAHAFPPDPGSGSIRNLKIIKHLLDYDCEVRVLSKRGAKLPRNIVSSTELLAQVPDSLEVVRTRSFSTTSILGNLQKILFFWNSKGRPSKKHSMTSTPSKESIVDTEKSTVQKLKDFVSDVFSIPDRYVGWFPFAVSAGIRMMSTKRADVIYAVGKPWTGFLVGYVLKFLFRKPLVIDFMDPWQASSFREGRSRFVEFVNNRLERFIVKRADFVIANTQELAEDFVERLKVPNEKVGVITCGYDATEFDIDSVGQTRRNGRFTITHTGTFYKKRTPLIFIRAIKNLLDGNKISSEELRVVFVGRNSIKDPELWKLLEDEKLRNIIERIDWVSQSRVREYLQSSDLLLLVQPGTLLQIPAKLYEYAAMRKPILALAEPGGAVANIVTRESWGSVIDSLDVKQIENEILSMVKDKSANGTNNAPSLESLKKYSVQSLAGKLNRYLRASTALNGNQRDRNSVSTYSGLQT